MGEKITWASAPATQSLTTSMADWTNATITLTPGVWQVYASISGTYATGALLNNAGYWQTVITDSANAIVQEMDKILYVTTPSAAINQVISSLPYSFVVSVSISTTYKIRTQRVDSAGTGSGTIRNESGTRSQFFAVRIA